MNKHYGVCAVSLLTVLAAMPVHSQNQGNAPAGEDVEIEKLIRVEKIQLVDSSGVVRGIFGVDNGNSVLTLSDKNGSPKVMVNVDENPSLNMYDSKNKSRLFAGVYNDGSVISLFDDKTEQRFTVSVSSDGKPAILMFDAKGKMAAIYTLGEDGKGIQMFPGESGIASVAIGLATDGSGAISLADKAGKMIWRNPVSPEPAKKEETPKKTRKPQK